MKLPRRILLAGLVTLGAASPVLAQGQTGVLGIPPMTNPGEGLPVGPMLFSPSVQMAWVSQDNLFRTPTDPFADDLYVARANFMFDIPVRQSLVRFAYRPVYREYKTYELQQNWSHFVNLTGRFEFSSGLVIDAQYRFVDGSQEIREVDPGGELVFGDNPFRKNWFNLGVDYWFTARDGVRLTAQYDDVAYKDPLTEPSPDPDEQQFYDYTRTFAGAGWLHQINDVLVMNVSYRRVWFDPVDTLSYRTSTSDEATVGVEGLLSPVVSTAMRVGWRQTQFDDALGDEVPQDYSRFIINGFVTWDMGHGSSLNLSLWRETFPSSFGLNAFYDSSRAVLTYRFDRERFFALARARYQINDYQVEDLVTGEPRKDDIISYTLGLGYRITRILSLYGSYIHLERDSTIPRNSFDANAISVGVTVGIGP